MRIAQGWDRHALVESRPLVLGGERVPFDRGLLGHSDGDVVAHAVADALLGAAGLPDLGSLFPSDDPAWQGADSLALLERVAEMLVAQRIEIVNLDAVIIAERPPLAEHLPRIRQNLARALGAAEEAVSIKAKSPEGVGALGRGEAIEAHAVALVARAAPDRQDG